MRLYALRATIRRCSSCGCPWRAVGVVLGITAVSSVLWLAGAEHGLPVSELVRVESLEDGDGSALDDHMRWSFQLLSDRRTVTDADLSERLAPSLSPEATAASFNDFLDLVHETFGAVTFVRFSERDSGFAGGLGVGEDGLPLVARIRVDDDGLIESWTLDEEPFPPRLPGLQGALVLASGWLFIVAGGAAHRPGSDRQAWVLVLAGVLTFSSVLILSSSSLGYTVGRLAPALAFVLAVWLLVEPLSDGRRGGALFAAALAAGVGGIAPLARDATSIGHPGVIGGFVDSAGVYRGLLFGSSLLTGVALTMVVLVAVHHLHTESRWRHPPQWATLVIAASWGLIAFGSSLDYGIGDGNGGGGALQTATLAVVAGVPLVIAFRQTTSRWDRPELAGLIVEIESGVGLQPAIARALEDPSVQVLTSPDGERLLSDTGDGVTARDISASRVITQIRSGGRLVGGLVHDAALGQQSDRLRAVVAAVGPALEVGRLSEELAAQLRDVQDSGRRIIGASDAARRRVERDLHDGAQQRLVALGLDLQRARRFAEAAGQPDLATLLESATADIRGTLDDIRSVSRGSHPALLVERGLGAAVDALAERSPVPVHARIVPARLPAAVEIVTYYVVAEGLANVAKHAAGATRASVSVTRRNGATHIEISDDGCGGAAILRGSGLEGLDDRVAAAGGTFAVRSGPAGTTLVAVIPCE